MNLKKLLRTLLSVVMVATLVLGSVAMLAGCQPANNETPDDDNNHALDYVGLEKEEYLQKLASNNLGDLVDGLGEAYGAILNGAGSSSTPEKAGAKLNMTLTMGDTALDLFEQAIFGGESPVDISFLKEINLDMDVGMNGQMEAIQLALGLKGQHIVSANLLMNMADSVIYAALPDLNDQWIKLEAGSADMPNVITGGMSSPAMLAELAEALPSAETLTKVLDRYIALILAGLKNVDQTTTTLEVGGVKQECTVLTLKLYEEDALNIVKSVLSTAKDDPDLKKIIEDAAKGIEEMVGEYIGAEEAYNDFKDGVEGLLADLEEETEFDTESPLVIETYVDKNHNVIGMKVNDPSSQGSGRGMVYFYNLTEGDKTAFEFAVPSDVDDTVDFKISGTGTKIGGKTSGTYTVTMQGMDMVTVKIADLNEEAGTITLTPSADLFPGEVTDMLGELSLQIKLSGEGFELNILGDNELLLGIAIKAVESDGPDMNEPSNAVDGTDSSAMEKWAEKLAIDKLMDNLEKAGAKDFFEALFEAQKAPAQPMPEYGYTDEGWG